MRVLLLRLDAPLMSFGTIAVDQHRPSGPFPALSMVTGLLGAALGYARYETEKLAGLQGRLRYAARVDRQGERLRDYQTVDLGQRWMNGTEQGVGWTSKGQIELRGGAGATRLGTHIRQRDYWADRIATLSIRLESEDETPTLGEIAAAVNSPVHPLYLGRKSCPPAAPLLLEVVESPGLLQALKEYPRAPHADESSLAAEWPLEEPQVGEEVTCWDQRDWTNQIHAGTRVVYRGLIDPPLTEQGQ